MKEAIPYYNLPLWERVALRLQQAHIWAVVHSGSVESQYARSVSDAVRLVIDLNINEPPAPPRVSR